MLHFYQYLEVSYNSSAENIKRGTIKYEEIDKPIRGPKNKLVRTDPRQPPMRSDA